MRARPVTGSMKAIPDSVRGSGRCFLLRHEAAAAVAVELCPERGVLLPETAHVLLHQVDVLAFDEQQGNTDNRYARQHNQRQTQAKYGLMSKSQHCNSLL